MLLNSLNNHEVISIKTLGSAHFDVVVTRHVFVFIEIICLFIYIISKFITKYFCIYRSVIIFATIKLHIYGFIEITNCLC